MMEFKVSACWHVIQEIKDRLNLQNMLKFAKVARMSNDVAYSLQQLGKCESNGYLRDAVPPCVVAVVANDCKNVII